MALRAKPGEGYESRENKHKTKRQKSSKVSVHHEANYAKACWTKMPCFVYSKIMEAVFLVPVALEHLTSSGKSALHSAFFG